MKDELKSLKRLLDILKFYDEEHQKIITLLETVKAEINNELFTAAKLDIDRAIRILGEL